MTNNNPSNWNTFAERPYTYDIADDQLSAGGVHLWQVRLGPTGWQKRIIQSNGGHWAQAPIEPLDDETGKAFFATIGDDA